MMGFFSFPNAKMNPTLLLALVVLSPIFDFVQCGAVSDITYKCPSDDPDPCDCMEAYGKVFLRCFALKNREQLAESVAKMAGYGITELLIENSNVSHIPRDLFKSSPVSRIKVKHSMMFYLFDRELENTANVLTEITVYAVDFEGGVDWNVLSNLKELQTLSVSKSGIEKLSYGMSELQIPLETLILEENYIQDIYDLAFHQLKNLKNLVLKKNFLTSFKRSMLPQPESRLQFLDLSFNKLKYLPEDMFDGMTELHSLLLRGNKFAILGRTYMEKVYPSLFFLDASNNPLKCNCDMVWLLSRDKPFHLFGHCVLQTTQELRSLSDLTEKDFAVCHS